MTRDQFRADLSRALLAVYPEEAEGMTSRIEQLVPFDPTLGEDPADDETGTRELILLKVANAVTACFPERGGRLLQRVRLALERPKDRGDATSYVGALHPGLIQPALMQLTGDQAGRLFALSDEVLLVGRSAAASVRLLSIDISRRHLEIRVEENRVFATDLRSMNGSFVNRARIEPLADVELREGDLLRVSSITFHVATGLAKAAATPNLSGR